MITTSVIICSYNGEDTVSSALDSAFQQTLPVDDFEVLFVDDGSTDRTQKIVESLLPRHPNLRYVRQDPNVGLPSACNIGIEEARGDFIIRLDDDDRFAPDLLESAVSVLKAGKTDLVYTDRYEGPSGDMMRHLKLDSFNLFRLVAAGTMMRRDMVRDIGGYRTVFWEEYDLYLRYIQRSGRSPIHIPRPLYYYYRRPGSLSLTASPESVLAGWEELKGIWGEETLRKFGWSGEDMYILEKTPC